MKRGSGKTKTEAKNELKEVLRDHEDGLAIAPTGYTVADAVNDWLAYGLAGRDEGTVEACTILSRNHVIPALGARKLRDLSAEDVDRWLATKAKTLNRRTLQGVHSCQNRSVKRAMARDKVKRNVVELCSVPQGQPGRPSKALTFAQAEAVLKAAEGTSMHASIVVALLTGARTEELRALTWDHVFLKGRAGRRSAAAPAYRCVALGPARRGHQDPEVPANARSAGALRRGPVAAVRGPGLGAARCW
ncbi:hypothetical protein GCM10023257_28030 [Streptomyces hyderabadensis]|uniref:Core-binding (CB) domain-containing protein n=1 Tax=Streptomyces hyderabadensis TaxID=598549 RepID=A0ABP9I4B2_9ACTN